MAYDEGLAERIRTVLADQHGVVEKKMFGGIAFMVRGHMSVGIVMDVLMVRVGAERWIAHGVDYAASIPAKGHRPRRTASRPRAPRSQK